MTEIQAELLRALALRQGNLEFQGFLRGEGLPAFLVVPGPSGVQTIPLEYHDRPWTRPLRSRVHTPLSGRRWAGVARIG